MNLNLKSSSGLKIDVWVKMNEGGTVLGAINGWVYVSLGHINGIGNTIGLIDIRL
jgi:hypothetical protein